MKLGYIKLYRELEDKSYYKKSHYVHLWIHLLMKANHADAEIIYRNEPMTIKRGQFLTSRRVLSEQTNIQASKIERILKRFQTEQQIEQQNLSSSRLITIINYDVWQKSEQQSEQQMNSQRTASEQPVNTNNKNKKNKNGKNDKKEDTHTVFPRTKIVTIVKLWNAFAIANGLPQIMDIKPNSTRDKHIKARMREDFFDFETLLKAIKEQPFLLGDNKSGFSVTFDWIINATNYQKIIEGNYLKTRSSHKLSGIKDWLEKEE